MLDADSTQGSAKAMHKILHSASFGVSVAPVKGVSHLPDSGACHRTTKIQVFAFPFISCPTLEKSLLASPTQNPRELPAP